MRALLVACALVSSLLPPVMARAELVVTFVPAAPRPSGGGARDSTSVRIGEVLGVRLDLVHDSAQPSANVVPSLDPGDGCTRIYVVEPGGPDHLVATSRFDGRAPARIGPLRPHQRLAYATYVFGRQTRSGKLVHVFDRTGTWHVRAEFGCRDARILYVSEPAPVRVGAPVKGWDALLASGIVEVVEVDTHIPGDLEGHLAQLALLPPSLLGRYWPWIAAARKASRR